MLGCVLSRRVLRHWGCVYVGAVGGEGASETCVVHLCSGQGVGNIIHVRVCSLKEYVRARLGFECSFANCGRDSHT